MKRSFMAVVTLLGAGCSFGGGDGISADGDDDLPVDEALGGGDGQGERYADAAGPAGTLDAGPASLDSAVSGLDAPPAARDASAAGATCEAPPSLACDPVKGKGCLPFSQCIAVPGDDGPAAVCVLSGIRFDDTCSEDAFSTNCPAQHACLESKCVKYCYCDADCDAGACVDVGGSTFKVCRAR